MSAAALAATTFLVSLVGGLVPLVNVELYLVSVSALVPGAGLLPVAAAASLGQVTAKLVLYAAGRGALRLPLLRNGGRVAAAVERIRHARAGTSGVVFASALLGVPPYYAVSVAAGVLRLRLSTFVVLGLVGRLLRFAAVFVVPRFW